MANPATIELDITPLENAAKRLDEALVARNVEPENALYVDATIQRFEFTYELAHKMIRRFLKGTAANPEAIDAMAFADLIRAASQQGLLRGGWTSWQAFRTARGISSHTYDEASAQRVLGIVPKFVRELKFLLGELRRRTKPPEAT